MTTPRRVVLLSRLSTQNAGNEALSVEFINLMNRLLPQDEVRALDRYPQYFYPFTMAQLGTGEATIVTRFDALVHRLAKLGARAGGLAPLASESLVRLDLTARELPGWLARIKRKIGFRKNMARLGLMGKDKAATSIATCQQADLLIWNPAGEIHPTGNSNEVMRLLLLVRLAQLSGAKTMIVNHSLEIADEALRVLLRHVYTQATCVCLRDAWSCREAEALGVAREKMREIPDMVFLAAASDKKILPPAEERFAVGAIGLAINGLEAHVGGDGWEAFLDGLAALGRPVVFLSNAMNHDLPFAEKLAATHALAIVGRQPTYREIRGFYSNLGVLVSSRLHSSIIALCENVPVVTIEPSTFKLTAIFEQLAYPIPTARLEQEGWVAQVLNGVKKALAEHDALAAYGKQAARAKAEEITAAYADLLRQR